MKDWEWNLKKQDKLAKHASRNWERWTIKNVEAGFEKFYAEHGRYPSSPEVDQFEYLPSSKQIQRNFGGLQKLRKEMKLEYAAPDHNRGVIRSGVAGMAKNRATDYEEKYYHYLTNNIPELYVHEHKVLRFGSHRTDCDFFIYLPNSNRGVAVDVFYAMDILNLLKQVNIKIPKYTPMPHDIYFVSINKNISQKLIDERILNRKTTIPTNIKIYNIDVFDTQIMPNLKANF